MKKYWFLCVLVGVCATFLIASCTKSSSSPQSSEKAITAFSFDAVGAIGVVDTTAKTISIQVPKGTDLTALVATFTFTGSKVEVGSVIQTSGATANSFSSPVVYTVVAADNSTADYTVTVDVQKHCMFVSALADPGDARDSLLILKVRSWKYNVTVVSSSTLSAMTADTFALYDFAFLSETPNSTEYAPLKGHPLPLLNLEAWGAVKPNALCWSTATSVANYDSLPLVISNNTGSPLAAGLSSGTEFKFTIGTSANLYAEIGFIPTITTIPIAGFKDSSLTQALITTTGIDSATAMTASGGILSAACAVDSGVLLADGATYTMNRAVTLGIHADAYAFISDEAYSLMQAGIKWILRQTN